jgi:diguanylate cyclase (GGDEF)-like protein/PAS domain S-box-containing protein
VEEEHSLPGPAFQPSTELLEALFARADERFLLLDANATVFYEVGPGSAEGASARLVGTHIMTHVHPDDLPGALITASRALGTPGYEGRLSCRVRRLDGSFDACDLLIENRLDDPTLRGVLVRVRPIERRGGDTAPVAESERILCRLAKIAPTPIVVGDHRDVIVFGNDAAQELFGVADYRPGEGAWMERIAPEDRAAVRQAIDGLREAGAMTTVTFRLLPHPYRWIQARLVTEGEGSARSGWVATFEDVTPHKRREELLLHRATHDPLTGLADRALFLESVELALAEAGESSPVALLFLDLERFKEVNDRYGHLVGDEVLRGLGERLLAAVRPHDLVGRFGGDEFAILCCSISEEAATAIADRILEAVRQPIVFGGGICTVRANIGIALSPPVPPDPEVLLEFADQAMYRHKRALSPRAAG